MKYLPFEDFEINTTVSSGEVFYRLRATVETKETWFILLLFSNKSYFGKVSRSNFRISRITKWLDRHFPPIIFGELRSEDSGSRIRIKVRLHWYPLTFGAFILGAVWYIFWERVANLIKNGIQIGIWQIESLGQFLFPVGIFVFAYLLAMGDIQVETKRTKEFLTNLLGGDFEIVQFRDKIFWLSESQIIILLLIIMVIVSTLTIVINLFQ